MGKKSGIIAAIGASALAVTLPFMGAYATNNTTVTDTIVVTIEDNCSLSYD